MYEKNKYGYGNGNPNKPRERQVTLQIPPGHVSFRLLCTTIVAGGLIGHAGGVIKRLQHDTSARITIDEAVSRTTKERVVHVIGSSLVDRRLLLDKEVVNVSTAQVGLLRVFERILEVSNPHSTSVLVTCRMLVGPGLAGAVIGAGGDRVNLITKSTGVFLKVINSQDYHSQELIQITGSSLSVKKALVMVSTFLQEKIVNFGKTIKNPPPSLGDVPENMNFESNDTKVNNINYNSNNNHNAGVVKVMFRLLCPCDKAGSIIGWKGSKVKALKYKTGAFVRISPPEDGYNEQVVTISAFENLKLDGSAAQDGLCCVFRDLAVSESMKDVSARLLIETNHAKQLNQSSFICSIQEAIGAEIHFEQFYTAFGASAHEQILQIDGDYSAVVDALEQVSWRLREISLETSVEDGKAPVLPHKQFNMHHDEASLTDKMTNCKISEEANGNLRCKSANSQYLNKDKITTSTENPMGSAEAGGGRENGSVVVTNTRTEIAIREDIYHAVFGDNGGNLARIQMISGATVQLEDPGFGGDGKVIISGKPNQALAAQSLLHTFIGDAQQF